MGDNFANLIINAQKGEPAAIAQLLSECERGGNRILSEDIFRKPKQVALRVGITGPPGAGKSTLTGQLITLARERKLKVGVIAVDPSSPFTNGAILADRIRYSEHSLDSGVFIRSLGTRGSLGGLSASAYLMARVFDACHFDLVIIETVGVGQTELEIINVADRVGVVLVPESGDAVQAMKAGLLEIANAFVINKSDRPGAEALANELQSSMELTGQSIDVFKTKAITGDGVAELSQFLFEPMSESERSERKSSTRLRAEGKALMRHKLEEQLNQSVSQIETSEDLLSLLSQ